MVENATLIVSVHRKNGGAGQTRRFVRQKAQFGRSLFSNDGQDWWITETPDNDLVVGAPVCFVRLEDLFEKFLPICRVEISAQVCKMEWPPRECADAFFAGAITAVVWG